MIKLTAARGRSVLLMVGVAALALYSGQLVSSQGRPAARRTVIVDGHEAVAGEVLVRFNRAQAADERAQMETQFDAEENEGLAPNTRRLRSRSYDVNTLVSSMRTRGDVAYAEPNYIQYALDTVPNDPSFASLWGLLKIHAPAAWDLSTGVVPPAPASVVAVVDTGVDYTHPDLAANVWKAPTAFTVNINGTLITCAANTHGFNAITNSCDPMDDNSHGTHVSGTIGAVGNNSVGVVGVNWSASIMGTKFLSASGSGSTSNAIKAIEFAIQAKALFGTDANVRVLSNSWGGGGFSQALLDEINKAKANDMLFVAAAGNAAANTDITPSYPASYTATNIVAVAATDSNDLLASFSNYGVTSVDLAAPGVGVLSTTPGNTYSSFSGTSMATPHVSGAAALVLSVCPTLTTAALKTALLNNVEPIGGLATRVLTGGRLNVDAAIRSCTAVPLPPIPSAPASLTATPGAARVTLSWPTVSGATSYRIRRGTSAGVHGTTVASVTTTGYTDLNLAIGPTYYYVVEALNAGGVSADSPEAFATPFGPPAAPTGVSATAGPSGSRQITVSWSVSAGATSYTVKRSTSGGGSYSTVASGLTTTSFTNTGLSRNRRYYYVVAAVNAAGSSPNSAQVNAVAP